MITIAVAIFWIGAAIFILGFLYSMLRNGGLSNGRSYDDSNKSTELAGKLYSLGAKIAISGLAILMFTNYLGLA